jgi:hypothetical protein
VVRWYVVSAMGNPRLRQRTLATKRANGSKYVVSTSTSTSGRPSARVGASALKW